MNTRRVAFVLVAILVLAAGPTLAKKKRRRGTGYEGPDPCGRVTVDLVRKTFKVPAGVDIESSRGRFAKEVCSLRWKTADADEVQAAYVANMGKMMVERMKAQQEGRKLAPIPTPRTSNEVSLTFSRKLFPDASQAKAAYEGGLKMLNKGITRTRTVKEGTQKGRDVTVTFQADSGAVEGVGDHAQWTPKLHQLSVHDGTGFFHLAVDVDPDNAKNKAEAIRFAQSLLTGKGGRK